MTAIQAKVDKLTTELEGLLNLLGLNVEPVQLGKQLMPETSSMIKEPLVFGRDSERDLVIDLLHVPLTNSSSYSSGKTTAAAFTSKSRAKKLKGESSTTGLRNQTINTYGVVSVLPIVGIGGVGKTTLVQLVYNDTRVKTHFGLRMWVCISDVFDIKKIIKDIIECATDGVCDMSRSLNVLQGELRKILMKQKFLLVLDDIWPNAIDEWQTFFAPFRNVLEGSVILVTTRFATIVNLATNTRTIELKGLPEDTFLEFFNICAFGTDCAESYPKLQVIGQDVASRLCGSPLAAKTLGRLLNMELTERHWITVQNSELWELPHQDNEILPALQLSYLYLPPELKRCLALCSMFPKGYRFERDEIVDIWVTHGFVLPEGSMHPEELGVAYLDDLRSRFLLQTDPRFRDLSRYVMHDLIHAMAQSVSLDECFLLQDKNYPNQRKIPPTVRHMSIEVHSEAHNRMADIHHLDKLHSLRFGTRSKVRISWLNKLSNILFLSLKGCELKNLPESICVLNHLRHLDISHSRIIELPDSFRCLYSLQVLNASHSRLRTIPDGITTLVNLRNLALPGNASHNMSTKSGLGNLCSLRNLSYFTVGEGNGRRISELKNMNQLREMLSIKSFANVQSMEETAEARIVDKQYLKVLIIHWRQCRFFPKEHEHDNSNTLEGLHPHSRIERLVLEGFRFDNLAPSWLTPENLPSLRNLDLSHCSLKYLSMPLGFPITTLRLSWCCGLRNLDQCLDPEHLPFVKSIELDWCPNLVSVPVHSFVGFVFLQDLRIHQCFKLVCPREMVLPPALRRLSVSFCGELGNSFPDCLENLNFLTLLHLEACLTIRLIRLNSINTNMLSCLVLRHCSELSSIEGSGALLYMKYVDILSCPKLTGISQPFKRNKLEKVEETELLEFIKPRKE